MLSGTQYLFIIIILKAYSLISSGVWLAFQEKSWNKKIQKNSVKLG